MTIRGGTGLTPKFTAAVDLLRRTGVQGVQVRYSDDEEPIVWIVVAWWATNAKDGRRLWETAAGGDPEEAVLRLCEVVVDGGTCVHCQRPTVFDKDFQLEAGIGADVTAATGTEFCFYAWDPELSKWRRACDGDQ